MLLAIRVPFSLYTNELQIHRQHYHCRLPDIARATPITVQIPLEALGIGSTKDHGYATQGLANQLSYLTCYIAGLTIVMHHSE
jgi:hypothetical protein